MELVLKNLVLIVTFQTPISIFPKLAYSQSNTIGNALAS